MARRFAPTLLAFSLIGGCAADHVVVGVGNGVSGGVPGAFKDGIGHERIVGEHVFAVGYARIADIYLEPVDLKRLTVDGLSGLARLDPALSVAALVDGLALMVSGRTVAVLPLPDTVEPAPWALLTMRAVDRFRTTSPTLAAAGPEEIYAAVFDAIAGDLDNYSRYTSAARAAEERSQREGYGGIGVALQREAAGHRVTAVMREGPAARQGIQPGDLVLTVEGTATAALTTEQLGERLRGPAGTVVTVGVSTGAEAARHLTLKRDRLIPDTVQAKAEDGVGVLTVERFNAATAANLRDAVQRLRQENPGLRGLVLDLRGNPGGLLDQAVAVADQFMETGRIVSTRGRHPDSLQQFDATPDDIAAGLPLVVLVDGRTASSAEIVAAALQDSGRAVAVGAATFGKGSVQTVTRLPNDGELFLTWSRIFSPNGYTLHLQGVQPVVCSSSPGLTPAQALGVLRTSGPVPASTVAAWKVRAPDDTAALDRLRGLCPWTEHAPELDLGIAKALLFDPAAYRQARLLSRTNLAER